MTGKASNRVDADAEQFGDLFSGKGFVSARRRGRGWRWLFWWRCFSERGHEVGFGLGQRGAFSGDEGFKRQTAGVEEGGQVAAQGATVIVLVYLQAWRTASCGRANRD